MKTTLGIAVMALFLSQAGISAAEANRSTAAQIRGKLIFTMPIKWRGAEEPPESESQALLEATRAFETGGSRVGIAALEAFVAAHPQSRWNPSLHLHLARHYQHLGRYSLALAHWEAGLATARDGQDEVAREMAAEAAAGWTRLLASLGRKAELETILPEVKRLGLHRTVHAFELQRTEEALGLMQTKPGIAYRCGSFALAEVLRRLGNDERRWKPIRTTPWPEGGFRLSDLAQMARSNQCDLVAVRRLEGEDLVVPSVVHWKLDHYAAIVGTNGPWYLVVDPTLGGEKWMHAETIHAEASGHFVVASAQVPSSWRVLPESEARTVHGKGLAVAVNDLEDDGGDDEGPDCPPPPPPDPGDGPGAGTGDPCPPEADSGDEPVGMAVWRVSEPYISLWVHDKPLSYQTSSGKPFYLRLSYNQRGVSRGPNLGGFGDKWECNWIGVLELITNTPPVVVTNLLAGGGDWYFPMNGAKDFKTSRSLHNVTTNVAMVIRSPYSRENRYGYPAYYAGGLIRLFLTNRTDKFGREFVFHCGRVMVGETEITRLNSVTDPDGRQSTLAYTNTTFPRLITSVTDPYNRTARFFYDAQGRLTNITDMVGMVSSFQYDVDGSITNLHTPYGNTSFRHFAGTNDYATLNRALEITEPTGAKQLYLLTANTSLAEKENSFHWNRQQYEAISAAGKANVIAMPGEDCLKATRKQWAQSEGHVLTGTLILRSGPVAEEYGSRVDVQAFTYMGQTDWSLIGTNKFVTSVDWNSGVNQLEIERNAWGRPTLFRLHRNGNPVTYSNLFDADGRILKRVWGANGEAIRGYGYDSVKTNLLTAVTNALGEVLRYTHGAGVRVTSVTQPGGLVTTNFYYDSGSQAGFLKTAIDVGFRTNSYGYANGNRVAHTNELGLVRTFTYDGLNRLTSTAYPDGTTVSNVYDKLDLVAVKDRLNHWTYFGYNALRQLVAATNANGQVKLYDYWNCGSPSQITELNGGTPVISQFSYDLAGRLTNATFADGYQLHYAYALNGYPDFDRGGPVRVADSSGLVAHLEYADYGALAKVGLSQNEYGPDGYLIQRTFDEYGRLRTEMNRNGVTVTNAYDLLGRLTNRATLYFLVTSAIPLSSPTPRAA